jgi:non-specific serine/threonine protein kinase
VGRTQDFAPLSELLGSARLLSLVGPGGVGKTRLSVELAEANSDRYSDGVWMAELGTIDSADELGGLVSSAVSGSDAGGAGLDPIAAVGSRRLLLILDNCEHLISAVGALARDLLTNCPRVHILSTSREPIGVDSEVMWRVPSLTVPSSDADADMARLEEFEAVQLFVERGRRLVPDFAPDPAGWADIARLCRELDGIPLALELAAARLRVMTPGQILEHLGERLRLLRDSSPERVPRHQTLLAALDWSFDLLDQAEQTMLARLSVFPASFDVDSAAEVGLPGDLPAAVDVLDRLVAKSLVQAVHAPRGVRFTLLETVRAYAMEKREARGLSDDAAAAHLEWFRKRAAAQRKAWNAGEHTSVAAFAADDLPHAATALATAARGPDDPFLDLASELREIWIATGRVAEARSWLGHALRRSGSDRSRANVANAAANFAQLAGDDTEAARLYEQAIELRRRLEDPGDLARSLNNLATLHLHRGELDDAEARLREAGDLLVDDAGGAALVETGLGGLAGRRGDLDEARSHFSRAISLWEQVGRVDAIAACHCNLAALALLSDDPDVAADHNATAAAALGELPDMSMAPSVLEQASAIAEQRGRPDLAAAFLGSASAARSETGATAGADETREVSDLEARLRKALGDDGYVGAFAAGRGRALPDVLADLAKRSTSPYVAATAPTWGRAARRGRVLELTWSAVTAEVPQSKGTDYLMALLETPTREIHVLDLAGTPVAPSTAQPVLDARARDAYRRRLHELAAERAQAEADADRGRLDRIDDEVAALETELNGAFGGPRQGRRVNDDTERARKSVTNRIRHAMSQIESSHPALGRHLRSSIRTGTFCSYEPERTVRWEFE